MDDSTFEEGTFVVDEVSAIIKEAMETIIGGNVYQHSKVPQWTNTTVEHILGQLTKMNKPFKYIGKEACILCCRLQSRDAGTAIFVNPKRAQYYETEYTETSW